MKRINREIIYTIQEYSFVNFINLSKEQKQLIWNWRNDERVRTKMADSKVIPWNKHINFIDNLKGKQDREYWLVYKKSEPVGVYDIIDIDYISGIGEPGYYLNPSLMNAGFGLEFNYIIRLFFFNILGFNKSKGRILINNKNAFLISLFFGQDVEGTTTTNGKEYHDMSCEAKKFKTFDPKTLTLEFYKFIKSKKNAK